MIIHYLHKISHSTDYKITTTFSRIHVCRIIQVAYCPPTKWTSISCRPKPILRIFLILEDDLVASQLWLFPDRRTTFVHGRRHAIRIHVEYIKYKTAGGSLWYVDSSCECITDSALYRRYMAHLFMKWWLLARQSVLSFRRSLKCRSDVIRFYFF